MKEIDIRDIEGFRIGNAENKEAATGCTAVISEEGAVGGANTRGGGPASRETELLKPENMVQKIHCVMLSGGSAYGLDACSGAMKYLEEKNIGFDVGVGVVPIVCGASIFDLAVGDSKIRPDKEMGYEACVNSEKNEFKEGNFGEGTGASVGKILGKDYAMKSGLGTYAVKIGDIKIGAVVSVNALGDVFDMEEGRTVSGLLNEDKKSFRSSFSVMASSADKGKNVFGNNTTIGCIITNADLTKTEVNRVARIAHNGFAKSISPAHTSADGDTIFAMASGRAEADADVIAQVAAEVMRKAVIRAAKKAESEYGLISHNEINKTVL